MRENRSHGPKMKLHARIFVSQPLCCAIPVPYMLPLFFMILHPQPFYSGLGTHTCLLSLISFASLISVLHFAAALLCRLCNRWRGNGLIQTLGTLWADAWGFGMQVSPILFQGHRGSTGWVWTGFPTLFKSRRALIISLNGTNGVVWDPFLECVQLSDNKTLKI